MTFPRFPRLNRSLSDQHSIEQSERELTLVQSENSDFTLLTPSINAFTGVFRDLSESDNGLERREFRRRAEQCGYTLRLNEDEAEIRVIDAV